jgi:hypothetical protein
MALITIGERVTLGREGTGGAGARSFWLEWSDPGRPFSEGDEAPVAQKIQVLLIDDLDGSEAENTVRFGLDGVEYEIDLSAEHAEALRRALAPFIGAARRSPAAGRRPARGGRRAGASGLDTTEVREWARAQGIEVKDRGRVPAEVIARFKEATGK